MARTLATPSTSFFTPILPPRDPAVLHMITGQSYEGQAFGAKQSIYGETVFSTSITSCKLNPFRSDIGIMLSFVLALFSQTRNR